MSQAEEQFLSVWNDSSPEFPLQREQRLVPGRRFRFDFTHPPSWTALELDGGGWVRGRHHRPRGRMRDYEKDLLAAQLGWQVIRFAPDQIDEVLVTQLQDVMRQRQRWIELATRMPGAG